MPTPDINTIKCPKCKHLIKLTEAMAAPLLESVRADFDNELKHERLKIREEESRDALAHVQQAAEETNRILVAKADAALISADQLRRTLATQEAKLAEAQREQARLLTKERELDDAKREMDLTIARRVNASAQDIRTQATKDAADQAQLRIAEKDEQLAAMTRQIDDLKRRAEQGSTQLQGEAQELVLEQMLKSKFPLDSIEPVAKGVFGGDCIQRVVGPSGRMVGTILWESKRTKTWSDGWLTKLRGDQRAAKAEMSLLVTQKLPADVDTFDLVDGVWVTSWQCAVPVAIALRQMLIDVANTRSASEGQATKAELMYGYLTGPNFKHRVQAVVEQFKSMAEDLDRERTAMTRIWSKREGQIRGAADAMAGMYGDLQGIAGKSLVEVDGLALGVGAGGGK